MTYIPHSSAERDEMLEKIGVKTLDDLFKVIPAEHRFPKLDLPSALTEMEAGELLAELASYNETNKDMASFLGAGMYNHYVPSVVDHILRRGEFYTAYTPYQPEISQGTLQAIFEYQSLMTALTGMELSNASHYDGATATAEAVNMAYAIFRGKRSKVVLSPGVHPQYRETVKTYVQVQDIQVTGDDVSTKMDMSLDSLVDQVDDSTALVVVQYPDFFGNLLDYTDLINKVHEKGALVCVVANPTALGLFKTPGEMGADIVVGEGQPLGLPLWFGGPSLGFFTTLKKHVHKMAGRLVGETVDSRGEKAYVLTLTAREQHIKRERATSNICSNQGLMALGCAVYMTVVGKSGLEQVANLCYQKAHYAAAEFKKHGIRVVNNVPFFHEFVIELDGDVSEINEHLLHHGIIGGYDLSKDYPTLKNHMLVAFTEMNSKEQIDMFVETLTEDSHA